MGETPLEQARRHVAFLERAIPKQEAVIKTLDSLGDANGVAVARQLLVSFHQSLTLARDHLKRLSQSGQ